MPYPILLQYIISMDITYVAVQVLVLYKTKRYLQKSVTLFFSPNLESDFFDILGRNESTIL